MGQLEVTNLFTSTFIRRYDSLALFLDKELKRNQEKYYVGEMPPYSDASGWCDCQDYPSNPWRKFGIMGVVSDGQVASFWWSWQKGQKYRLRARKEANGWRIEWLEKFNISNYSW
ncbi:hypothetical protein GCM10028786_19510 [Flaviaesturariibacter terrae]